MIFCIKYRCYIMIELTFLKELMLIRQATQKRAIFITIGRYHNSDIFNERHDLLIMCS